MDPNYLHIYWVWVIVVIFLAWRKDMLDFSDPLNSSVTLMGNAACAGILTGFTWLVLSWCLNIN